jgi:hypothetical protein
MSDDVLLTLHCPQCKEITEVITDGANLVCLECGWRFDEQVAARFLANPVVESPVDGCSAER